MKIKDLSVYNFVVEAAISRFGSSKVNKITEIIDENIFDFVQYLKSNVLNENHYFLYFSENSNENSIKNLFFSTTQNHYDFRKHCDIVYFVFQYIIKFDV
jgi:hypothetical protein